jgi:hypothetical protein
VTEATACGGSTASSEFFGSIIFFPQEIASQRHPFNSIVDEGLRLIKV